MRILLIEDDAVLQTVMVRSLNDAGHRVDAASHLEEGAHFWQVQTYDAVLLDLNLPLHGQPHATQGSGLQLLREARARGDRTPVLVLTARNRTDERIAGLDAGADDYLGKPFDLDEVEARLRALVRRTLGVDDDVYVGRLHLQRKLRRIFVAGADLSLPAREFEVLCE
ncbi:MAG: response regulator transcription factor, partial [Limnohabitans sp.]|nr:response regulator transcription factor [Limnohabitans sp.]